MVIAVSPCFAYVRPPPFSHKLSSYLHAWQRLLSGVPGVNWKPMTCGSRACFVAFTGVINLIAKTPLLLTSTSTIHDFFARERMDAVEAVE